MCGEIAPVSGAGKASLLSLAGVSYFKDHEKIFKVRNLSEMPPKLLSSPNVMLSFGEPLMKFISPAGCAGKTEPTSGTGKANLPSFLPFDGAVHAGILMHDERFKVDSSSETVQSL